MKAFFLTVLFAIFAISPIAAQNSVFDEQKAVVQGLIAETKDLAASISKNREDDEQLVEIRLRLEMLSAELLQSAVAFRPRLQEIKQRLDQLGPSPDGENEPQTLREERAALNAEKAEINALIGEAENASLAVNKMMEEIAGLRREIFANTLTKRYDLSFAFGQDVLTAFWDETAELYNTFYYWLRFVIQFKLQSMLLATFFSLAAAVIMFVFGRRYFEPMLVADPRNEEPSYLSRLTVAFFSTLLPTIALVVFFGLTLFLYETYSVLRNDIRVILSETFEVIALVFFINRLAHGVLVPRLPNWRLVSVHSDAARTLVWLATAMAFVNGLDFLLAAIYGVLGSPLQLTVAANLLANLVVGFLVVLVALVKPLLGPDGRPRKWPVAIQFPLFAIGLLSIGVALLGYVGLASFISQQIVVTVGILVTMYIGFLSAGAISAEGALEQTLFGKRISSALGLGDTGIDRLGLFCSMLTYFVVLLIGIPVVLLNWGFRWGDIKAWAIRAVSEINVGSVSFSIVGILTGILVFFLGYLLTRWIQHWLDGSVLSRSRIDAGVRNSVKVGIGYLGIALAALIGISAAGIDLSNLALVAGALSLGIGFGLQNIVSNFVSGLILLAERPFKVGDWIIAGSTEGTVKRINVRATEIETFQRQTVILPNSDLINQAVGNWTHRNKLGRLDIAVGVAYGSDVRKVRDILVQLGQEHPLVIKNPEPAVLFKNFGDSSLDFELRLYLFDVLNVVAVQNDIRFGIVDAFAKEGIEIPFPQRDLHIKSDPQSAAKATSAQKPKSRRMAPGNGKKRKTRKRPDPDS